MDERHATTLSRLVTGGLWLSDENGDPPDTQGLEEATGLSFLLPYWLGRHYGLVAAVLTFIAS